MCSFRISILMCLSFIVVEGISFNHQTTKVHRTPRSIYPFFRPNLFDSEECTDDQCRQNDSEKSYLPQISGNNPDFNTPNDEMNEIWLESFIGNGLGKRSRIVASSPVSWTFPNGVSSTSSTTRPVFENTKVSVCTCQVKTIQRELDSGHFPRYLTETQCISSNCWPPPYSCKDIKLKIYILKEKREGDIPSKHVPLLPEPLRENFMFLPYMLSVGCECSL